MSITCLYELLTRQFGLNSRGTNTPQLLIVLVSTVNLKQYRATYLLYILLLRYVM